MCMRGEDPCGGGADRVRGGWAAVTDCVGEGDGGRIVS